MYGALYKVATIKESFCIYYYHVFSSYVKVDVMSLNALNLYATSWIWLCDFFHFILCIAPSPPSLLSFADVTNTSLAITWKGPPDWTDYNDFELQWLPRDALTLLNPYRNRKSEGRIVYGLHPGRFYQFSVKTVSGDSWKTYSKPVSGSVRTSMACFASLGIQMGWEDHLTPVGFGLNP